MYFKFPRNNQLLTFTGACFGMQKNSYENGDLINLIAHLGCNWTIILKYYVSRQKPIVPVIIQ